jgi:hypothetical protein
MAIHEPLFQTILQAFGAVGLPVTFCSAAGAFVRSVERAPAERVATAVNSGMAVGFAPGSLLATVVLVHGVWL